MTNRVLDNLIRREAGFVNHPADRGGPTKYGITAATLGRYRRLGRPATAKEVAALTELEARQILSAEYVTGPGFDQIRDPNLQELVVDCGVNSGQKRAVQWLQAALGVTVDGQFGPQTRAALAQQDATLVFHKVVGQRIRFLGRLITNDPSQAAFAAGWMNRVAEFLEEFTWDR